MKAFVIDRYAKQPVGRFADEPTPPLGPTDVRVDIHAASVNPLDLKIAQGEFKLLLKYDLPLVLGNDFAGVVREVGSRVTRFAVGDDVFARTDTDRIGAFAESIVIRERSLAHKPKSLDMVSAAALPLVALTAWQALVERAELKPGQKVLIHAGSGGVGSLAIQLAKHLGAYVATTTGTANVEMVKDLGADTVVDYRQQDFEKVLSGYDLVLNSLPGDTVKKSARVLKRGGLLVSISGPPDRGFAHAMDLNWALTQVMGLLSYPVRRATAKRGARYEFMFMTENGEQLEKLAALVDAGKLRPVIDRVFPFTDTQQALDYVNTGRARGKVVISLR